MRGSNVVGVCRREQGVVCSLKEGFGFIRCVEREQKMFFHFAEVLRLGHELTVADEVCYLFVTGNTGGMCIPPLGLQFIV